MNFASNFLLGLLLLVSFETIAQSKSEKLKKEQSKLEQKIADTKLLLSKTKSSTASSLNELKVIENQIRYREQLLKNYDNQIRGGELKVQKMEHEIASLHEKIDRLKVQYRELLIYAYKHRNKYGRLMYVFSAGSYHEAKKRTRYLERIADIQQKQFLVIQQNQSLIKKEIQGIQKEKEYKLSVISEKRKEKEAIQQDQLKQEEVYKNFKSQEEELIVKLKEEEKNKQILRERINEAIRKEIAEAEERKRREEEARRRAEAERKAANAATTPEKAPETKSAPLVFADTKEIAELSRNFEGNQGKLPWPVDKGSITENFGKNPHPTLKDVYTNNRGIDISTPRNAQVRAVFEGEVTSVLNIPGAGKVVIIKHGNYRTVYSNLQDTYVKTGMTVSTKKVIGSLLAKNDQNLSVLHFEIHKVEGSNVACLNPNLWVAK